MISDEERAKKLNELDRKVKYSSISFNRIPQPTLDRFCPWAINEFCEDYGMAFKHLVDFYFGLIPTGWEHLEVEIASLRKEMEALKAGMVEKEEPKGITMLNGRIIRRG
jgi:hypothetical protein